MTKLIPVLCLIGPTFGVPLLMVVIWEKILMKNKK